MSSWLRDLPFYTWAESKCPKGAKKDVALWVCVWPVCNFSLVLWIQEKTTEFLMTFAESFLDVLVLKVYMNLDVNGMFVCVWHVWHMRSFASTPWAQQMCSTQCIWWMKLFESSNPCAMLWGKTRENLRRLGQCLEGSTMCRTPIRSSISQSKWNEPAIFIVCKLVWTGLGKGDSWNFYRKLMLIFRVDGDKGIEIERVFQI